MSRIEQLQNRVADALAALGRMHDEGTLPPILQALVTLSPPHGTQAVVELRQERESERGEREHGRRDRDDRDDREERWDARGGEVHVTYRQRAAGEPLDGDGRDPMADLVEVLVEAERNPHLHFVALKFLRDRLLPQTNLAWASAPASCQRAVAAAIERGILVTSKKPNPRNPAFPVTAVQLNRDNPEVMDLLEGMDGTGPVLQPSSHSGDEERDDEPVGEAPPHQERMPATQARD